MDTKSKKSNKALHAVRQPKIRLAMLNPAESVGTKLLLTVFACIAAVVLIVGLSSYQTAKKVITERVADSTKETIVQATDKIELFLGLLEGITVQILSDETIISNLTKYKNPAADEYEKMQASIAISNRLSSYALSNTSIIEINIVPLSPDGNGFRSKPVEENLYQQEWLAAVKEAGGGAVWLPTRTGGYLTGLPSFAQGRVLRNLSSGQDEGILIVEMKPDALREALGHVRIGEGGEVYILDAANRIILGDGQKMYGELHPADVAANRALTQAESGSFETKNGEGAALVVYDSIADTGWFAAGSLPVDELVGSANDIRNIMWIMVAVSALLAGAIGLLILRNIVQPLANVTSLMMKGAKGNLTVRMQTAGRRDEIGKLGESFNRMMEQIAVLVQQTGESAKEVLQTAEELSEASKRTDQAAREIAAATQEIAGGAASLASEAERGSELTAGIGKEVQAVVAANRQMESVSEEVQLASQKGIICMANLTEKASTVELMTRSMSEKVEALQQSTSSIREILELLDYISQQTNILALNATIEAARAGDAGKGFMVVADEIRKLANESRRSIDTVGQITGRIQAEMKETADFMAESYPLLKEQIVTVKEADEIFRQVQQHMVDFLSKLSEAAESVEGLKQSQTVLTDAIGNVSAVAQQSSATSEEVASLCSEQISVSGALVNLSGKLEELSASLKQSLGKFTI